MGRLADARRAVERAESFIAQRRGEATAGVAGAAGALRAAYTEWADTTRRSLLLVQQAVAAGSPVAYDDWGSERWRDWAPEASLPRELRVGAAELAGTVVPATVPLLAGRMVLISSGGPDASDRARDLMASLAVRCALAGNGRTTLHVIDPLQEGYGFEFRQELPRVARRTEDAAADLKVVVAAAHEIRELHNGIGWTDLDDATRAEHPLHVVFALDFPRGYSYQAVEELNRIGRLAPAGVQLVVHQDLTADRPGGARGLDLDGAVELLVEASGVARGPWGALTCAVDAAPTEAQVIDLAARLPVPHTDDPDQDGGAVSWSELNPTAPDEWWRESATSAAIVHVGRGEDGEPLDLRFGFESGDWHNHAVVAGAPGSGKSVLLHTVILGLATAYPPEDLQLFLIDGQDGVELQSYDTLPHAELVLLKTPVDLARGVLRDVDAELARRSGLLVDTRTSSIDEYQALTGNRDMPRLVVIIDEYQRLFLGDAMNATAGVLQRIAAEGRKVGIHLLLASQSLHATGLLNQDALFTNITTRIALKLPTDAIDGIDEFARDGRQLIRSYCTEPGRAAFNDRGGAEGGTRAGRVAFCPKEKRRGIVEALADKAVRSGWRRRPEVINGSLPPSVRGNRALARLAVTSPGPDIADWARDFPRNGGLGLASWQPYDHPVAFIVGRTLTVHGSAVAKIERRAQQNVLLVASDPEALVGMVLTGLVSVGLSVGRGTLTAVILNELPPPGSWAGVLTGRLAELLAASGHRSVEAGSVAGASSCVRSAIEELDRRLGLDPEELATEGPYLVVGLALDRLPAFRRVDGRYGAELSEIGSLLRRLATEGPFVGIHVVMGATSRPQFEQVLDRRDVRQFQHRLVQQMSADDSRVILDSSFGTKITPPADLGPQRAGYVNAETGEERVFLPYSTRMAVRSSGPGAPGDTGDAPADSYTVQDDLAMLLGLGEAADSES